MVMNKADIKKIVIGGIGVILLLAIGYGIYTFVQYANGNTPAQIEARKRIQEAAEQADKAMSENHQWYQDQIDKFQHPATSIDCTNSDSVPHQ